MKAGLRAGSGGRRGIHGVSATLVLRAGDGFCPHRCPLREGWSCPLLQVRQREAVWPRFPPERRDGTWELRDSERGQASVGGPHLGGAGQAQPSQVIFAEFGTAVGSPTVGPAGLWGPGPRAERPRPGVLSALHSPRGAGPDEGLQMVLHLAPGLPGGEECPLGRRVLDLHACQVRRPGSQRCPRHTSTAA